MNTERHGINRRIHGNIRALVEQAKTSEYDIFDTKRIMKILAATFEGYPMTKKRIKFKGKVVEYEEPASLAGQPDSVALILNQTIQAFADERNLYLYEYDFNDRPFRSIGGRNKADMIKYCEWLRQEGREDEARILEAMPKGKKKSPEDIIREIF